MIWLNVVAPRQLSSFTCFSFFGFDLYKLNVLFYTVFVDREIVNRWASTDFDAIACNEKIKHCHNFIKLFFRDNIINLFSVTIS